MPYSGKTTYGAGADLPELVEDVSDIISIVSPYETPLLDHLGDPDRAAQSTVHEWMEDELLPNFDSLNQTIFSPDGADATDLTVHNGSRFRVGDLVRPDTSLEIMLVTAVAGNDLTVIRRYGGTAAFTLTNGRKLFIVGNGALEGDAASAARHTSRIRRANYTQIFTATVDVSGSMQAVRKHGVADEVDYQKQERMRELLRDLENCVINGTAPAAAAHGGPAVRRSMSGIIKMIESNRFVPGQGGFPGGGDLSEAQLNAALRLVWEQASGKIDTIVVNGAQKRRINQFVDSSARFYSPTDRRMGELVSIYESDFGVCNVVLSRWVPSDTVLLLDSSRIDVLPLVGRSFQFRPLGTVGDSYSGQLVGEYTLEFRNEIAHGLIRGLAV